MFLGVWPFFVQKYFNSGAKGIRKWVQLELGKQGSRLTFQFASPVASDRFDPLAKTNFSLARHLLLYSEQRFSQV